MEENQVFALARTLQNTTGAQREIASFLDAMRQKIDVEYLQKIRTAAALQQQEAVSQPPKEVTLLRALSAFVDTNTQKRFHDICQSLLFCHTLQQIQNGMYGEDALLEARSQGESYVSPASLQFAGFCMMLSLLEQAQTTKD